MPQQIKVAFRDDYNNGTKQWAVVDQVCLNNVVWSGYLSYNEMTPELSICSDDGIYGCVVYQREDGAPTRVDNITDGSVINMS